MQTTIDKAGRIIVPKALRERYNLREGTRIELEAAADGIHLKAAQEQPSLVRKSGVLVHHGSDTSDIDVADFVNREREKRARNMVAEDPAE